MIQWNKYAIFIMFFYIFLFDLNLRMLGDIDNDGDGQTDDFPRKAQPEKDLSSIFQDIDYITLVIKTIDLFSETIFLQFFKLQYTICSFLLYVITSLLFFLSNFAIFFVSSYNSTLSIITMSGTRRDAPDVLSPTPLGREAPMR